MSAERSRQLEWFIIMLAVAVLGHEATLLDFFHRLDRAPLASYYEGYAQLVPTLAIPVWLAPVAHVALIGLCGVLLVHPRRRALGHLLFPLLVGHFFLQGCKVSNHFVVLIFATFAYGAYGVCEWIRQWTAEVRAENLAESNVRFLARSVLLIVVGTYVFAALAKINTDYLEPRTTTAQSFMTQSCAPLLFAVRHLGGEQAAQLSDTTTICLGLIGILSTFLFEGGLPLALLVPRWRRWTLTAGLCFHLAILFVSALDFTMLMVALYVLLIDPKEFEEFRRQYVARWNRRTVVATIGISGYLSVCAFAGLVRHGTFSAYDFYRLLHIVAVTYLFLSAVRFSWSRMSVGFAANRRPVEVEQGAVTGRAITAAGT
jgi:hypothetical protein